MPVLIFLFITVVSSLVLLFFVIMQCVAMLLGQTNSLTSLNRRFINVIARILELVLLSNYH